MFNKKDPRRNKCMLRGKFRRRGYDWWWHSFTAKSDRTGKEVPFFVEYFLCNPALAEDQPVLGQLAENKAKGKKPSYIMVKAGCWGENKKQLHRFFAWKDIKLHEWTPYSISADDCFADDTALRGSISISEEEAKAHPEWMCDAGTMKWDLKLDKQVAFNVGYGASTLFRVEKAFEMYWHAEGMKTFVSGKITIDGEDFTVIPESSYGYSDKNWGCGFTSPWVWLSSWDLTSNLTGKKLENSVFDIGGGRPKAFGIALERKLLSAFWYEGKPYEFNFSKFLSGTKTKFSSEETEDEIIWYVEQENHHAVMETNVRCFKKDMIWVNYEDPDGNKRFEKLWNGGNGTGNIKLYRKKGKKRELIDDIRVGHIGCEYGEFANRQCRP